MEKTTKKRRLFLLSQITEYFRLDDKGRECWMALGESSSVTCAQRCVSRFLCVADDWECPEFFKVFLLTHSDRGIDALEALLKSLAKRKRKILWLSNSNKNDHYRVAIKSTSFIENHPRIRGQVIRRYDKSTVHVWFHQLPWPWPSIFMLVEQSHDKNQFKGQWTQYEYFGTGLTRSTRSNERKSMVEVR